MIVANVGRFGPYVKHGTEFRSLEEGDDVYTITLDRAKGTARAAEEVEPPAARGAAGAEGAGLIPERRAALRILDGRYGPYVTDGTTNASLPKGTTPRR